VGDARPYLEPGPDAIRAGAWCLLTDGREEAAPDRIAAWDMSHTLRLRRHIELDLDRVIAETRLRRPRLAISVVYVSDFEDEACRITLDQETGVVPVEIEVELDGAALGSTVTLLTSLVLTESSAAIQGPVAWRRGSILWQDPRKITLFGNSSQFPLMEIDFTAEGLDPASPWFVQIGPDLELPAMGSILLLLNERFPLVTAAAKELDADRPELAVVRSALYTDVGRVLVETALSHEEIGDDWPDDSLGAVLSALLLSRFSEPVDVLRRIRENEPANWTSLLEARLNFLREPLR
jgi:hypothetical protein